MSAWYEKLKGKTIRRTLLPLVPRGCYMLVSADGQTLLYSHGDKLEISWLVLHALYIARLSLSASRPSS